MVSVFNIFAVPVAAIFCLEISFCLIALMIILVLIALLFFAISSLLLQIFTNYYIYSETQFYSLKSFLKISSKITSQPILKDSNIY